MSDIPLSEIYPKVRTRSCGMCVSAAERGRGWVRSLVGWILAAKI